ncbi:hypothetical protein MKK88_03425 [Methylobacterium sp. E-005]|uniref:hypothetical protein n=1 Tax=Methylobacterium sp. E-005 TaxID=2836549 RepID=UPI001FB90183|nr:hypothetical protein [Methylobacterium sp. E-005]MCJ2085046.1 hypothetical protein [Methylobacterium sp. E-005]
MDAHAFDTAIQMVRRVCLDGEPLPPIAHASGRPTARLAAELLAFLREVEQTVTVAARTEGGRVIHLGAREGVEAVYELPPGCRLVPRGHPL